MANEKDNLEEKDEVTPEDDYMYDDINIGVDDYKYDDDEDEPDYNEDNIAQKLAALEKKTNDSATLAKILADPDVRKVLEAKEKGRKISLQDIDEKKVEVPEFDDEDELTSKVLKKVFGLIQTSVKPLEDKLANISSYVENTEGSKIKEEINAVRAKYPDFENYRETMVQLNRQNSGLSVEELYFLAKARKGSGFNVQNQTETERPRKTTAKPSVTNKKAAIPGKRGFDAMLNSALEDFELK
jgi:phosphoenolpyruvate carboxylase